MNKTKNARTGIYTMLAVMLVSITKRLPGTKRLSERLSTGMTTLVLAAVVLLVAAGGASAAPCPAPGDTDISTSCELDQDWTGVTGAYGYKIVADDVVIAGMGYKISGTVSSLGTCGGEEGVRADHVGIVVNGSFDNAVIKDLKIENFCTGIAVDGSGVNNTTISGCEIYACGKSGTAFNERTHGIHTIMAPYCTITKNTIYKIDGSGPGCGGGGCGIYAYGGGGPTGNYGTVDCNYIHDNHKSGVFIKKGSKHWTISNNRVTGNGDYGIQPSCKQSSYCTIEYNYVAKNAGGYESKADHNTLRFNTFIENGALGIDLKSGTGYGGYNTITNNTICGHTTNDIQSVGPLSGTDIAESNTCDSTTIAGACPWNCEALHDVYYDYDDDSQMVGGNDYYSDVWAADACMKGMNPTVMPVGSCNNPGSFNKEVAEKHCDYQVNGHDVCILVPGQDPNDCCPVPEVATLTLVGLGLVGLVGYIRRAGKD